MSTPRPPRPNEPTLVPSLLLGLFAAADAVGAPTSAWLSGTGLARRDLEAADARVPVDLAATIVERALPSLPADVGLQLGRHQHIGNFGLVGLAMSTAATFGEALQIGLRFTPVIGGLMRFVELPPPRPGVLALGAERIAGSAAIEHFVAEEFLSSCLALACGLLGETLHPVALEFAYPAPAHVARYREVFACPLAFEQAQTRLLLDARVLALPLRTHNPTASWQVLALCEAQMLQIEQRAGIAAEVARLLGGALAEEPRLAAVAERLHVSERTLRRQLSQEGTSFHAIHDRLRIERALALLQEPKLSIAAVGAQIGFRDPREFRRAFKRWTGTPPSAARARRG
ncbi:MAG: AraC family transcriptional regulator [Thermomonas sp.]